MFKHCAPQYPASQQVLNSKFKGFRDHAFSIAAWRLSNALSGSITDCLNLLLIGVIYFPVYLSHKGSENGLLDQALYKYCIIIIIVLAHYNTILPKP